MVGHTIKEYTARIDQLHTTMEMVLSDTKLEDADRMYLVGKLQTNRKQLEGKLEKEILKRDLKKNKIKSMLNMVIILTLPLSATSMIIDLVLKGPIVVGEIYKSTFLMPVAMYMCTVLTIIEKIKLDKDTTDIENRIGVI